MADQGPFVPSQPDPAAVAPEGNPVDPGQGGNGNELHQQFLSSVPENLREAAQQLVPEWDKHVQGKFTEAANYRKQWEPYEQLGLTQHQPDAVQQALALQAAFNDPDQLPELYSQLGEYLEQNNLMPNADPIGLAAENPQYETDPLYQTVTQMQQQMSQVNAFIQQQQEQQARSQAETFVNSQLEQIKSANPSLGQEDMDAICSFALKYDGQEAIQRGFAEYQALMSRAERGVFTNKGGAPAPANSGGVAATSPAPITSFDEAAKAARERLLQGHQ